MPRWLPEARTRSATRATRLDRSSSATAMDAVLANGFTERTSAPILASTAGITIDAAPYE